MQDPSGNPRQQSSTLSLTNFIASLGIEPRCVRHNAGNDAMMTLLAFQMLCEPGETKIPTPRSVAGQGVNMGMGRTGNRSPAALPGLSILPSPGLSTPMLPSPMSMYGMFGASPGYSPISGGLSPFPTSGRTPDGYFEHEASSVRGRSSGQLAVHDRTAGTRSLNSRKITTLPPETGDGFGSLRGQRPRVSSTNSMGTRELTGQLASLRMKQQDPSNP